MTTEYVIYITKDGDRWDSIAYEQYGDALAYEPIIVENRHVPIRTVLEGGIELRIPVRATPTLNAAQLPPWKRSVV
jgi:phage tail protein X